MHDFAVPFHGCFDYVGQLLKNFVKPSLQKAIHQKYNFSEENVRRIKLIECYYYNGDGNEILIKD